MSVLWKFSHGEECYYINWSQMEVCKGHARHSLKGRIWNQELYEVSERPMGKYHTLYKASSEAFDALKEGLLNRIACIQERLREIEARN